MASRRTQARLAIASQLLAARTGKHWGYDLSRRAGVGAGSMYPFLGELLAEGYLEDGWEAVDESLGRPPRRYYKLTSAGEEYLRGFVGAAAVVTTPSKARPALRPAAVRP